MTHGGHSLLARGLYAFQLEQYLQHWPSNQIKVVSIKEIQGSTEKVMQCMNDVFDFVGLPSLDTLSLEPKNSRDYQPMTEKQRNLLEEFYQPFNERLFKLLGRRIVW